MAKDLKEKVVEHGDTIALLVAAIIALILVSAGILQEKLINAITLLVLCLLALHHLRYTFRIKKMHEQIEGISGAIKSLRGSAKLLEEMGILRIAIRRMEIPYKEMHDEARNAERVFVLSRYFTGFHNKTVQETLCSCVTNGGTVQIIIYSPQGSHLDVKIESDITSQEANHRTSHTLRLLKEFKQRLPLDVRERFQYKILHGHIIYTCIIGTPKKIFATIYLNELRGEECPTVVCTPVASLAEHLYAIYLEEFKKLWEVAKEVDQNEIAEEGKRR